MGVRPPKKLATMVLYLAVESTLHLGHETVARVIVIKRKCNNSDLREKLHGMLAQGKFYSCVHSAKKVGYKPEIVPCE